MSLSGIRNIIIPEGNVVTIHVNNNWLWGNSADKFTWPAILESIEAGTYTTDYKIGQAISLDLGDQGLVHMQIAGFDVDDLADGSGKAHISFISKELLPTSQRMNPELSGTTEGTGAIGGWEKCEMRTYLNDTIKPLIPEEVATMIKTVTKTQPAYNTSGIRFTQTTEDDVWIPSYAECFGNSQDTLYKGLFKNTNANRVKEGGIGMGKVTYWWLRSANDTNLFYGVNGSGNYFSSYARYSFGIALGFCI